MDTEQGKMLTLQQIITLGVNPLANELYLVQNLNPIERSDLFKHIRLLLIETFTAILGKDGKLLNELTLVKWIRATGFITTLQNNLRSSVALALKLQVPNQPYIFNHRLVNLPFGFLAGRDYKVVFDSFASHYEESLTSANR